MESAAAIDLDGSSAAINSSVNVSFAGGGTNATFIQEDLSMQLAVPVVFAIIFVAGLIGNSGVIFIVLKHKKMRNAPNIFIANLSVGDLLLIVLSVPIASTLFTLKSWPFGEFLCKLSYFMKTLTVGVSVFTLTALSADRMVVIAFSMNKYHNETKKRIVIILGCIWGLSFALAIPDAVGYHIVSYSDGSDVCAPYPSSWMRFHYDRINVVQHFLLYYAIPLVIISVCYGITARVMVKSSREVPGERVKSSTAAGAAGAGAAAADKQIRARKKVANMVIMLVVLFFVCWLPRRIYLLWYNLSTDTLTTAWIYFRIVGYCLSFCTACVNPIALYFVSKQFRKHYKRDILCRFTRGTKPNEAAAVAGVAGSGGKLLHASSRSDSHVHHSGLHTQLTETPNGSVMSVHSTNNNLNDSKSASHCRADR